MKKRIAAFVVCIALCMSVLTSCFLTFECNVTYDYGGARDNLSITVIEGSLIPSDTPEREGYVFGGWYTDKSFSVSYDFGKPIAGDITLYAKWIEKTQANVDYKELMNEITTSAIRATVQLSVEKYDVQSSGFFGGSSKLNISVSTGSGVIYAEDSAYYYCLTNNHVVAKGGKSYADISILDYKLGTHTAELIASDPDYDLAAVRFKKNSADPLCALKLNTGELAVGETVIAIGSPEGQINSVTFGDMLAMETVNVDPSSSSLSNVAFPVIKHDAYMNNGSSGGALLNSALEIAGINYAAASSGGEFAFGYAVPALRAIEFLQENGLQY